MGTADGMYVLGQMVEKRLEVHGSVWLWGSSTWKKRLTHAQRHGDGDATVDGSAEE